MATHSETGDLAVFYRTLELEPGASAEEVKAAYLDLVKVWHPDRYQNEPERLRLRAQEKLKAVNEAYARLRGLVPKRPEAPRPPAAERPVYPNVLLRPMRFGSEWGYVDGLGRLVIRPMYALAFEFSDGLARVAQPHPVYRLIYGFIDGQGEYVILPQLLEALDFSEGLAPAVFSQQWGFIDRTGTLVIHPLYEKALRFKNGLAPVRQRGQWGYIGRAGEYVIPPRFDEAREFTNDFGIVRLGDRWGRVTASGEVYFLAAGELPE